MAHNTISLKYKCSKHCFPLGTQVAQIKEELAVANRQSDVTASLEQQLQAVNLKVNSIQEQVRVQKQTVKSRSYTCTWQYNSHFRNFAAN